MFLVRRTRKTDYDYYLKSFKSSHFRLYGNIPKDIENYVNQVTLVEYLNVFRFIVEKNKQPVGFFHLNKKSNSIIEISNGVFEKYNSIYGVYISILAITKAFSLDKKITKAITEVHIDNISAQKINLNGGGKIETFLENKYIYTLDRKNFPNNFVIKVLNRIKREGLIYES